MKIDQWVANIGENSNFVTFMAHCFFAAFVVAEISSIFPWWAVTPWAVFLAVGKEFWFDLRYEQTPAQTVLDSERDFAGYLAGIVLGVLVSI